MGILDDIFDSGAKGVSGVSTQIVSTYSQKNGKNENEYGLSGSTRHLCPTRHADEPNTSHQSNPLRSLIEELLAGGPKPYAKRGCALSSTTGPRPAASLSFSIITSCGAFGWLETSSTPTRR